MPFNGDTRDYSGRKNHGFSEGVSFSRDRFGNPSSACYFPSCYQNDLNAIVRIPFSADFDFSNTKELSAGFWADTTALDVSNSSFIYDCFECFQFCLSTDESNQTGMWITVRGSHCWLILRSGRRNLQGWHHYFMTLNDNQICMYIDGNIIDSLAVYKVRWQLPSIHSLLISKTGKCRRYKREKGSIDSFRLYNRRLSAQEIKSIYSRRD